MFTKYFKKTVILRYDGKKLQKSHTDFMKYRTYESAVFSMKTIIHRNIQVTLLNNKNSQKRFLDIPIEILE